MLVKITDYNRGEVNFVTYQVSDLSLEQLNFLKDNLGEETDIILKMSFTRFKAMWPSFALMILLPAKKLK